jgi:PIN domain nuclease of toxin-antitoxin system
MNYLLDTHTLIWTITEKNRLSNTVRRALENADNLFFVSSITYWEIALKFSTGKLKLLGFFPDDILSLSVESGFQLISLSPDESATYHKLKVTNHKDPFDRMLIWQALQQDLVFITSDKAISEYKEAGLKILW